MSLSTSFQLNLTILSFWIKKYSHSKTEIKLTPPLKSVYLNLPKNGMKTEKAHNSIEFCIFELV